MCTGSCGDGTCGQYEDANNCSADCPYPYDATTEVKWPTDGVPWSSYSLNWPDWDAVGNCYGNCGKGCSEYAPFGLSDVCGSPDQYWQLNVTSSPTVGSRQECFCVDDYNKYQCGTATTYSAYGYWTYYGWKADGCYVHDTTCRTPWWAGVAFFVSGFFVPTPGYNIADLWLNIFFNPLATCYLDAASFAEGGACANSGPAQWGYGTSLYAEVFTPDHYEYGSPGSCYVGPPKCGDGICQDEPCGAGDSGTATPGNGCEEHGGFNSEWCYADCP
jgi:hypothetical protein